MTTEILPSAFDFTDPDVKRWSARIAWSGPTVGARLPSDAPIVSLMRIIVNNSRAAHNCRARSPDVGKPLRHRCQERRLCA